MNKSKKLYFDYAAATPLDRRVERAMAPYWSGDFYNPSALYMPARRVRQALETARHQVAQVLGAKQTEIIFTAGATEANNLAIIGLAAVHDNVEFVTTTIEHESVLAPHEYLKQHGWQTKLIAPKPSGIIEPTDIKKAVTDKTVLVSVAYANNEIGTIQPIRDIARLLAEIRADRARRGLDLPLLLHTDASQAASYLDLHVGRLGVDLMTLNGGKMYGPKQTGCLYVKTGVELVPLIHGGGQERGLRSGTENVAGCIGLAKALELAASARKDESQRLTALRDDVLKQLEDTIEGLKVNGHRQARLPNNLNLTIEGVSGETLLHHLDQAGILAATGAACSANDDKPSPTLLALGLTRAEIDSSLRITLGRPTTKREVTVLAKTLPEVVNKLRQLT